MKTALSLNATVPETGNNRQRMAENQQTTLEVEKDAFRNLADTMTNVLS